MIYETYVCSLANGLLEYGFTFKHEGADDSLFDLVLDCADPVVRGAEGAKIAMDEAWAANEWAAKAIVASAP